MDRLDAEWFEHNQLDVWRGVLACTGRAPSPHLHLFGPGATVRDAYLGYIYAPPLHTLPGPLALELLQFMGQAAAALGATRCIWLWEQQQVLALCGVVTAQAVGVADCHTDGRSSSLRPLRLWRAEDGLFLPRLAAPQPQPDGAPLPPPLQRAEDVRRLFPPPPVPHVRARLAAQRYGYGFTDKVPVAA